MRLFVTVNTARASHSPSVVKGTSTFCRVRGDDNEFQLSDQFQRVHADYRLCGSAARRRCRRSHGKALSTAASRSGRQGPKSPMRTERAYVADDRSLSVRSCFIKAKRLRPTLGKVLTWPRQVWEAGNDFRDRQFGLLGRWCSLCGWLPLRGVGLVYVTQHHVSLSEDGQDFSPFGGVEPNP